MKRATALALLAAITCSSCDVTDWECRRGMVLYEKSVSSEVCYRD